MTLEEKLQLAINKGFMYNPNNGIITSKYIGLGHYNTPEEAKQVYLEAKKKYHTFP